MPVAKLKRIPVCEGLLILVAALPFYSCVKSTRLVGSDNFYVLRNPDQKKSGNHTRPLSADKRMQGLSQSIDKTMKTQAANTTWRKAESSNTGFIEEQVPELARLSDEVKKAPDSPEAHFNLALSYHRYRVLDKAYEEYQRAIRLNSSDARYYENMGRLWRDWGAPQSGIQDVQRALLLNPDSVSGWLLLGTIFDTQGEFLQAERAYGKALELDPTRFEAHNNLCFMYLQMKDVQKALAHGEEAVRLNPGNRLAHNNLGLAYGMKGDDIRALSEFRLGGDEASAHNNLGLVMMKQDRYAEAMTHFKMASRMKPFYRLAAENYYLARKLQLDKESKAEKQTRSRDDERDLLNPVEKGSLTTPAPTVQADSDAKTGHDVPTAPI